MVISKTPVRVSFFGGGTDYPDYYKANGGCALSTSINKYIYITVKATEGATDFKYRIAYSRLEQCQSVDEIQHPVVRAAIKHLNIPFGLEIHIISDLPARTGIGSSSAFTVGLYHALYALLGKMASKEQLANDAIYLEQVLLQERVGVQDQLAAAYGSLNHMIFDENRLEVNPLPVKKDRKQALEANLMMFYTGVSRFASEILEEQVKKTKENKIGNELQTIKDMVARGVTILTGDEDLDEFGKLLHEAWMIKRNLSSAVSNPFLDDIYNKAMGAGALGGKLLGAGGGGFFVFYVPQERQEAVRRALEGFNEIDFSFENGGSRIIHYN